MESKLLKSAILRTNNIIRPYPTLFYFPGIRSKAFWDQERTEFKTISILEKNYKKIKDEYMNVINNTKMENDYKFTDHEKFLHQGNWEWFNYISKGSKVDKFKDHFPITNNILNEINETGELMSGLPFSYTFFSRLAPKSSIAAHYGPCNIRLRIHLALDIPESCYMKVSDSERKWEEGNCLIFDDTYVHEVHNNSEKYRSLLLVDIWHPDIDLSEREAIVSMFSGAYDKGWLKK
jgi:aspartate beta-hydroxylase